MSTLRDVLRRAGFTGAALTTAEAVAQAESGGDAHAHNDDPRTGDNSYGLFQINMLGAMGPQRRAAYGLASNAALFDPLTNAEVAFKMSNGGRDWSPWTTFKTGAYKAFLGGDAPVTNGTSSSSSGAAGGSTSAQTVGLVPGVSDLVAPLSKVALIGTVVVGGAALVLLGLNRAAKAGPS